ncbi:hypothetical protein JW921_08560 [Candidatus Fermentibacterales bacterium]|nr:hypothetical protein [Candidatus Fermentibacterales bacterium]
MNVTRTAVARRNAPGETMSFADYCASPGINFSTLMYMADSPVHFHCFHFLIVGGSSCSVGSNKGTHHLSPFQKMDWAGR